MKNIIKKAIISYSKILSIGAPFKILPNLKNGKCEYKKLDTGPLNKNANITDTMNPPAQTNSLKKPLKKPNTAPNKINPIIIKSTKFTKHHSYNKIILHFLRKRKKYMIK